MKSTGLLAASFLSVCIFLLTGSQTDSPPTLLRTEELKKKAYLTKQAILQMQATAEEIQTAIESKLGLELDRIEWRGSLPDSEKPVCGAGSTPTAPPSLRMRDPVSAWCNATNREWLKGSMEGTYVANGAPPISDGGASSR
jgi:hypothetical protein